MTRFMGSESLPSFLPIDRYARLHLPYSGSLWVPLPHLPDQITYTDHRYYDPLRLPPAHLVVVRFSLSFHDTVVPFFIRNTLLGSRLWSGASPQTPGVFLQVTPYLLVQGNIWLSRVPELPP